MQESFDIKSLDEKSLKLLRLIQISTLLPLALITAFILYFKVASEFGILVFFFLLFLGVFVPQTKGDLILTRIVLKREVEEKMQEFRKEMETLLSERLGEKATTKPGKQNHASQTVV